MRNNKLFRAFLAVIAAVGAIVTLEAQAETRPGSFETAEETASRAESCKLLRDRDYARLDQKMNALQHAYEAGKLTDISLLHFFRSFCNSEPWYEREYRAWSDASPDSYAARLATGAYLRDMAYLWRGKTTTDKVTPGETRKMDEYIDSAMAELKPSLALTTKPILSYRVMMGLACLKGDAAAADALMRAADKIDPKNFIGHDNSMVNCQPE